MTTKLITMALTVGLLTIPQKLLSSQQKGESALSVRVVDENGKRISGVKVLVPENIRTFNLLKNLNDFFDTDSALAAYRSLWIDGAATNASGLVTVPYFGSSELLREDGLRSVSLPNALIVEGKGFDGRAIFIL
jgi:hypothetical protein